MPSDPEGPRAARFRTETIGDATLILGDCREVLPTLGPVDAVVTDPVWPNMPVGMFAVDDIDALFRDACAAMPQMRQMVVCMRTDCDPRFLRFVPGYLKFLTAAWLPYMIPGYAGRVTTNEVAYTFGQPIPFAKGQQVIPGFGPRVNTYDRPQQQGVTWHPCPRTLRHQEWLMRWFTLPGGLVLDPFMGSGTSAIAALNFGRQYIGIESDAAYFDAACKRIDHSLRQPRLFAEPQPEQTILEIPQP